MRALAAFMAVVVVAACGEQRPDAPPSTFGQTRDAFITVFNEEAALNESGGLSECGAGAEQPGVFSCRITPLHRAEAQAHLQELGVEMPGFADGYRQYVTLETSEGGLLSRVMIAGDRRVYGALQMVNSLATAARVLGGDVADEELEDGARLMAFMDGLGLVNEPPPFGTQVAISRSYAEITCTLATEDPLVYACYLTPPGARLNIHLR